MIDAVAASVSGYLDSKTAARYMGFHTVRTFRQWARRVQIKAKRRSPGRMLVWKQSDLDATLQDDDVETSARTEHPLPPPEAPRRRRARPRGTPRQH